MHRSDRGTNWYIAHSDDAEATVPYPGYVDLVVHPERIPQIPEVHAFPPLAAVLAVIARPDGSYRTTACDSGCMIRSGTGAVDTFRAGGMVVLAYRERERNTRGELEGLANRIVALLPAGTRMLFAMWIAPFQEWHGDMESGAHYLKIESGGVADTPQQAWRIGATATYALASALNALD